MDEVINRLTFYPETNEINLSRREISFTGRIVELTVIEEFFNTNQSVIICGLDGIGKTELARQFAWKYKTKYRANIIWINAEVTNTISEQFRKVAIKLQIEYENRDFHQIIKDIYKVLNQRKSLIIFDNLLSKNDVKSFLLQNDYENVNILVTSQNTKWSNDKLIKLGSLSSDEAIEFLQNKLMCKTSMGEIEKLVEELQYFPLALQQAVAYINNRNQYEESFTLTKYIKEFKQIQLLNEEFPDYFDNLYEKTIYTTLLLTVQQISGENENALKILHGCCYFDADHIVEFLFENILTDVNELNSATRILLKYSLLNKQINELWNSYAEPVYIIHRVVQLCYRQMELSNKVYCQKLLKQLLYPSGKNYYGLMNNLYWKDLSIIEISDYKFCFGNCPSKKELMYYLGYYECNKIIEDTKGLFNDEHYFQGLRGATRKGSLNTIKCIYLLMKEKLSSNDCKELLKIGAHNNFTGIIKFMHENGNNIDEDYVCYVARRDEVSIMKCLVNIGIDIKKAVALHEAIYNENNIDMIKYLIQIGYDLNKKRSYDGNTALHIAVQEDYIDAVKYLIQLGKKNVI